MGSSLQHRQELNSKLEKLVMDMSMWEEKARVDDDEANRIRDAIRPFSHTTSFDHAYMIGGVDGSGDYPCLSYSDSFVSIANASGTVYETVDLHGLAEVASVADPNLELVWLPEDRAAARPFWIAALSNLSGISVSEVIANSDYRKLKDGVARQKHRLDELEEDLILPAASDTSNVAIQLRSTAEFGAALRLIRHDVSCRYVLMDTTLSLPMVSRRQLSLYYEHLKRLCCVEACRRGIVFMTISKGHGLPCMEIVEQLAAEACATSVEIAEHWFLRLPIPGIDNWELSLIENRSIPPAGAVTYLVRFHRNTPVVRIDVDRAYWELHLQNDPAAEVRIFSELDYASHDQRAYGYPYPIKACHDRVRLSMQERAALKKQIVEAAVARGMKRSLFRDVSTSTGHV
ncbi:hypothetical protein ACWPKO_17365 [Coraliomargarita sp. W4R53]